MSPFSAITSTSTRTISGNYRRLFDTYHGVIKVENLGRTFYVTNDPEVARLAFRDGEYFTKAPTAPGHPLYGIEDATTLFFKLTAYFRAD